MNFRASPTVALAAVILASIASCAEREEGGKFADLRGESTAEASVPSSVHEDDLSLMDLETVRWVGEHEGSQLWLGAGQSDGEICLLIYESESDAMVACGSDTDALVINGGDYTVVPDGVSPPAESRAISENVYVDG